MRIPAGEGNAGGTGLITPWDSREWDRFLQAAKMKEEIIWEGARLLLFPDVSLITSGKREELTVVGEGCRVMMKNRSASFSLSCQAVFYKQCEDLQLLGSQGSFSGRGEGYVYEEVFLFWKCHSY